MKLIADKNEKIIVCDSCDCLYQYEDNDLHLMLAGPQHYLVQCPKCNTPQVLVIDSLKKADVIIKGETEC